MKTKKLLSLLLAMTMIFSMMAFPASAAEGHCDDEANCLVCNVADLINALPAAEDITVDNAAAVTDQIHAIDRIKVDLTDDEYTELLALVDTGADGSGQGLDVPVRYMEAVEAIVELDAGNSLYIAKNFVSADGSKVDVTNAIVEFEITNIDTNKAQTVALSTMDYIPNSLSANADFYTMNDDGDGWTYKFILPDGTYHIKEASDSGAIVNGEEFVTTACLYDGELADGVTVTLAAGTTHTATGTNINYATYNIDAVDADGNSVSGVKMTVKTKDTEDFTFTWTTDAADTALELQTNSDYTISVDEVPSGYKMPETASVDFNTSVNSFAAPFSYNSNTSELNVVIEKEEVVAETHSHPVCGDANCTEHGDSLEWQVFDGSVTNLTSGNWYLANDVELTSTLFIGYEAKNCTVRLCLNGHKLTFAEDADFNIVDGTIRQGAVIQIYQYYMISFNPTTITDYTQNKLELCDCNGANGSFTFSENEDGMWVLDENGDKVIEGGIITGGVDSGIKVDGSLTGNTPGTLNMYGGTIVGNQATSWNGAQGGGIDVGAYKGTLNMYGGRIVGNLSDSYGGGIGSGIQSIVNITGGVIDHNTAKNKGGGISVESGGFDNNVTTFNISEASIESNTAADGGGIYCSGNKNLTGNLTNVTVQNNVATNDGGGICINGFSYSDYGAPAINMNTGTIISENTAKNGGGIALSGTYYGGVFNANAGTIKKNTATNSGGGVYVKTASSKTDLPAVLNVKSADALIEENTATYGGGIYCDEYSTLNFVGGTVQSNSASVACGGVYAINGCSVSGKVTIKDNTVGSGEDIAYSNVCGVDEDALITVGEIDNTSVIEVSAPTSQQPGTSVQFTSGGADYIDLFSCETENTLIEKTADGANLQFRMLDVNERIITVDENIENGTISVNASTAHGGDTVTVTTTADENYVIDTVTVTKTDGSTVDVTVDAEDETKFTFTMPADNVTVSATFKDKTYAVNISSNFIGGTVTADVTEAKLGDTVTLTAQPVLGYSFDLITVTDAEGNTIETSEAAALFEVDAPTSLTFTMPASEVTVDAVFTKKTISNVYTVEAVVTPDVEADTNVDKDTSRDGMHVYADDMVRVDVVVNGANYTNADWTLVYDYGKFTFDHYVTNTAYETTGYITHDETGADNGVIIGYARGVAGETTGDEFVDGDIIVSYYFKAIPHNVEVTGKFNITSAHVNNYEMAGIQDNTAATSVAVDVTIILITDDDDDDTKTPAGSIEAAEKKYNALEQSGNEYVLDAEFEEATVTYAIVDEAGNAVTDTNGDGSTADEIAALTYKTGLPTWKNVGTYTYYVKISGDGLATIYDSTTLKITPATLTPSATFAVDPAVDKVTIIPELQGVLDGSHNGQVTVKYTDKDGAEQTATLEASDFIYDGESTSVYNGVIEVEAQESGIFTVTLDYTKGENDNYTGEENTASVDVDKLTADDETIKALEDAIESVFPYDSVEHYVEIGELPEGWTYETPVDAYDETITDPSVTNVGDERLVKVVFTDTTNVYNDVIVYVVLKVTPAKALIDIYDQSKAVGEEDPEFTYNVQVLNDEGNVVIDGGLYTDEELAALEIETVRTPGETAGPYTITASYVPNANYEIEVYNGTLTIGAPSTEGPDADVKIEIVDLSNEADGTPDYVAGKRLVLVYTNLDKAYYGYGTADNYEKMFDVTGAGYKYVDNIYADNQLTTAQDDTEYAHVYGIVVDKIADFEANEEHEKLYRDNVIFLGSDAADAPENIVYDADINMTGELDVNDYSMNNGIYNINNINYDRVTYMKSILKADYDHSKAVDTDDSRAVKNIVDTAKVVTE